MHQQAPISQPIPVVNLRPDEYFSTVQRHVVRMLAARPFEADDVAQSVVARWWHRRDMVISRYPDPWKFAKVAARHALISWQRTERSQRCQGSRLVRHADGSATPAREWLSGDRALSGFDTEHDLFSLIAAAGPTPEDVVVEQLWADQLCAGAYRGLSPADIAVFELVELQGYQVTELARHMGVARETLARRLSRIRHAIAANHANTAPKRSA